MPDDQQHDQHGRDDDRDHDKGGEKAFTIIVNGRERTVTERELGVDDLVKLAFENPPTGEFICFTITYRRGNNPRKEGTVPEGGSVKPKEGMIFNVTATDKS